MGFETSYLTDKRFLAKEVWTYPMGFETRLAHLAYFAIFVWTYPMGFETRHLLLAQRGIPRLNIPYGIWNILYPLSCRFRPAVWTYPMGFETRVLPNPQPLAGVWTYPMGFETLLFVWLAIDVLCLNIPYGIWNLDLKLLFKSKK